MDWLKVNEVVKDKFLLISYSHAEKKMVETFATHLLNNGVRLFFDNPFNYSDEWFEQIKFLLSHENCCGAILFFSVDSILSQNVSKEWAYAYEEKLKRDHEKYRIFPVNVCNDGKPLLYMQLLKKVFDSVEHSKIAEPWFFDNIRTFMRLIDMDPLAANASECNSDSSAANTCEPDYMDKFIASITEMEYISKTINKNFVVTKKLEKTANINGDVIIDFGLYNRNGKNTPIKWRYIQPENDMHIFLSEEVLCYDFGGEHLKEWLNSTFKNSAFANSGVDPAEYNLRLLTVEETENLPAKTLSKDCIWWLEDRTGNMQKVICDDGSLYSYGYHHKKNQYGVRPVLIVNPESIQNFIEIE